MSSIIEAPGPFLPHSTVSIEGDAHCVDFGTDPNGLVFSGASTWMFLAKIRTLATDNTVRHLYGQSLGPSNPGFSIGVADDGSGRYVFGGNISTTYASWASSTWSHYASFDFNEWFVFGLTWTGLAGNTSFTTYTSKRPHLPLVDVSNKTIVNSGAVSNGSGAPVRLGNRTLAANARIDGEIGFAARWNRELSYGELELARALGPLAVPRGLVLFWIDGADRSPFKNRRVANTYAKRGPPPMAREWYPDAFPFVIFQAAAPSQFARPVSDVSAGAWSPSAGSDLYSMLDEAGADDGDYIFTFTGSTCEVMLAAVSDPGVSTGHIVRYRSNSPSALDVELRQGASTVIASWAHSGVGSLTNYAQTLSGTEADSITNYADLRLRFIAS